MCYVGAVAFEGGDTFIPEPQVEGIVVTMACFTCLFVTPSNPNGG
jgi:hypothetical protein